jgi:hypothetical protein
LDQAYGTAKAVPLQNICACGVAKAVLIQDISAFDTAKPALIVDGVYGTPKWLLEELNFGARSVAGAKAHSFNCTC